MPTTHLLPPRSECTSSQCLHFIVVWARLLRLSSISIILRTLCKIREDKATGIMVVSHWPTQSWWPYLTNILIAQAVILPRISKLLYLPAEPERIHPLSRKVEIFQTQLQTLSTSPGGMEPKSNMQRTCDSGRSTVVNKILIPFQPLYHKE